MNFLCRQLLEFSDIQDHARIDKLDDKNIVDLKLQNFQWHSNNLTKHENLVEFYTEGHSYNDTINNETRHGKIRFLVSEL